MAGEKGLWVQVEYQIGRYRGQEWAAIDTDFSDGLCLPSSMLPKLREQVGEHDGTGLVELANGSKVKAPYYIGCVKVSKVGQEMPCHIYLLGNEPLVGLKALQGLAIVVAPEPKILPLTQSIAFGDFLKVLDP